MQTKVIKTYTYYYISIKGKHIKTATENQTKQRKIKTQRFMKHFFIILFPTLLFCGCHKKSAEYIPAEPDYSDATMWYSADRGGSVDIFYIISTEIADYKHQEQPAHYADPRDANLCQPLLNEMQAVDRFFSDTMNYYSPYYRQATLESWTSEDLAVQRLQIPLADCRRAWQYYLDSLNHGRPFIIAGYSQGAHLMLDLLCNMPDSIQSRMVAAYSFGYKITNEMLSQHSNIIPARGEDDLGVVINFNSVCSSDCIIPIVSDGNVVCINPVNWHTDTTAATFTRTGNHATDTITIHCDTIAHLLIVEGFNNNYVLPVIGREGNYHHCELTLYTPYIKENMHRRAKKFLKRQ